MDVVTLGTRKQTLLSYWIALLLIGRKSQSCGQMPKSWSLFPSPGGARSERPYASSRRKKNAGHLRIFIDQINTGQGQGG